VGVAKYVNVTLSV